LCLCGENSPYGLEGAIRASPVPQIQRIIPIYSVLLDLYHLSFVTLWLNGDLFLRGFVRCGQNC
jgi:hypothetical protein